MDNIKTQAESNINKKTKYYQTKTNLTSYEKSLYASL